MPQEFILHSDHEALRYLNDQKKLSARHGRWIEFLQDYTYNLKHISRVKKKIVDALSRRVGFHKQLSGEVTLFERIKDEYDHVPTLERLIMC